MAWRCQVVFLGPTVSSGKPGFDHRRHIHSPIPPHCLILWCGARPYVHCGQFSSVQVFWSVLSFVYHLFLHIEVFPFPRGQVCYSSFLQFHSFLSHVEKLPFLLHSAQLSVHELSSQFISHEQCFSYPSTVLPATWPSNAQHSSPAPRQSSAPWSPRACLDREAAGRPALASSSSPLYGHLESCGLDGILDAV